MRMIDRLSRNLVWGAAWGTAMGAAFCLVGTAIVAIRGPRVLAVYGISYGTMMFTYLASGLTVGLIVGLARPMLRWRVGAIVVGVIGGIVAYAAIESAMDGPVTRWTSSQWIIAIVLGLFAGSNVGNWAWERFVEPNMPPPDLPPGPPPPCRPLGQWRPQ